MDELVSQVASDRDTPVMVRAAMAHLNLVMIHPFRDGNGRMSRCLQTLVLAREQILAQELCSIEEYLGRNTQSYYKVLADVGRGAWCPDGEAIEWVRYCLTAHYVQAASVLRRIQESERIWMELDRRRSEAHLHDRTMAALFDAAIGLKVRNASYRSQTRNWQEEISNQVATLDLKAMVTAGFLRQLGASRGTYYVAMPALTQITADIRANRTPIDAGSLFSPVESNAPQLPFEL